MYKCIFFHVYSINLTLIEVYGLNVLLLSMLRDVVVSTCNGKKEERKKGQLLHPNITTCTEKKNLLFEILPTLNDEIIQRFIDSFHTFCISYTFFFFQHFIH